MFFLIVILVDRPFHIKHFDLSKQENTNINNGSMPVQTPWHCDIISVLRGCLCRLKPSANTATRIPGSQLKSGCFVKPRRRPAEVVRESCTTRLRPESHWQRWSEKLHWKAEKQVFSQQPSISVERPAGHQKIIPSPYEEPSTGLKTWMCFTIDLSPTLTQTSHNQLHHCFGSFRGRWPGSHQA